MLDAAGLAYVVNPRLVRGFDYYNRTVFEFIATGKDWELTIAGGGRYDGLIEQLGGKPAPSCGFGVGVERVMMLLAEKPPATLDTLDAYLVYAAEAQAAAWQLAEQLRDRGLAGGAAGSARGGGARLKAQRKEPDGSGARLHIVLGGGELGAREGSGKGPAGGEQ